MDSSPSVSDPDDPAGRLVARAAATDRAGRFEDRMRAVEAGRRRRRSRRRLLRLLYVLVGAGVGVLVPILVDVLVPAITGAPPSLDGPTATAMLAWGVTGAVVGGVGPSLRERVAARRGASAWDAYRERHVLLGNPSTDVRDADRRERTNPGT